MSEITKPLCELEFLLMDTTYGEDENSWSARWSLLDQWMERHADVFGDATYEKEIKDFVQKRSNLGVSCALWFALRPEWEKWCPLLSSSFSAMPRPLHKDLNLVTSGVLFQDMISAIDRHDDNNQAIVNFFVPKAISAMLFKTPVEDDPEASITPSEEEVNFFSLALTRFSGEIKSALTQSSMYMEVKKFAAMTKALIAVEKIAPQSEMHFRISVLALKYVRDYASGSTNGAKNHALAHACIKQTMSLLCLKNPSGEPFSMARVPWGEDILFAPPILDGLIKNPYLSDIQKNEFIPPKYVFQSLLRQNDLDENFMLSDSMSLASYAYHHDPEGHDKANLAAQTIQKNMLDMLLSRSSGDQGSFLHLCEAIDANPVLKTACQVDHLNGVLWSRFEKKLKNLLLAKTPQTFELESDISEDLLRSRINELPRRLRATVCWVLASSYQNAPVSISDQDAPILPLSATAINKIGYFHQVNDLFSAHKTKKIMTKKVAEIKEKKEREQIKTIRKM